jgi:hypothetical protein
MPTAFPFVLALALSLGAIGSLSGAQGPPASALIYRNDCPHEPPCADSVWVAHARLPAYARLNDTSRRAFGITSGQRLRFHRAFIVVDQPGRLIVMTSRDRYRAGDTVHVLGYEGEGDYRVWHRDTVMALDATSLEADADARSDGEPWLPRFTWWAEVSVGEGRRGWLALRNVAAGGIGFNEHLDMRPDRQRR